MTVMLHVQLAMFYHHVSGIPVLPQEWTLILVNIYVRVESHPMESGGRQVV